MPISTAAGSRLMQDSDVPAHASERLESRPAVRRRRILVATYHFPPESTVGGLRLAKFARLLPEQGWDTHVLTIDDRLRAGTLDETRLRGLERTPRTTTGELPRVLEAFISLLRRGRRRDEPGANGGSPRTPTPPAPTSAPPESLTRRMARYVVSLVWFLPDDVKNWSLRAAPVAVRLIRRHKLDWVLTSGPPFSVHVIGLTGRILTGARWAADFRDPWMDLLHTRPRRTRSLLSDRLERWMEASVVRWADLIVLTTEPMRDAMRARYPEALSSKFVCIPNSIDTDAVNAGERLEKFDVLTITYAGTLYFDRSPETLFRAVSDLVRRGIVSCDGIRIKLIGHCQEVDGIPTRTLANRYGLDGIVEVSDPMPYAEVVRVMKRSHLLLALAPERHRMLVGAKMYDYLGSGSALLVLADPGATADLVAQTGCGRCFGSTDVEGVAEYLASIIADGSFHRLRTDPARFSAYDARRLAGRLADEMNRVDADRTRRVG
jgi:glycosyltransferase involved in cell wall biosynthesis